MAGHAQTTIAGYVGREPELRYTQNGVPVCDFSVAVTLRLGKDDAGNPREETIWHRVTCWRGLAEIAAQFVQKGGLVVVVGTARASAYINKAGEAAASLDVTADTLELFGNRDERRAGPAPANGDDIPF